MSDLRVGLGVDAHALAEGVPLVLGGVPIDHPRGLVGHSDGDVIAHALTDALLGAAGLGDIGSLFPSDDERFRGADSLGLLAEAYRHVQEAGFELVNADCILVGEEPRIAPYRDEMRRRLADALGAGGGAGQRARDDDGPARVHGSGRRSRRPRGRSPGAHVSVRFVGHEERPDIRDTEELWRSWPTFMLHDDTAGGRWGQLYERFGEFQFWGLDETTDELLIKVNCVPVALDADDLPADGWREALRSAVDDDVAPTILCALQILVAEERRGAGLSSIALDEMRRIGAVHGFADLVAPVRPTLEGALPAHGPGAVCTLGA